MRERNSEPWRLSTNRLCIMTTPIIHIWISAVLQNSKEHGLTKVLLPTRKDTEEEAWFMTPMNGQYKEKSRSSHDSELRDFCYAS